MLLDTSSHHSMVGAPKDVLESSAKIVDIQIQQDNSYPELVDCLKMGGATLPTVSGLNDQDYPGVSELSISLHSLAQLSTVKRIPLPSELVEQFSFMQSNCQMGLMPEIGRAWLTIDSNIFLWSFHDGSDLAYYDGLSETILCVGLVKPKPGIFQDFIHYLLCLTTPIEIVVLGVNFTRRHEDSSPYEEMHMLPEALFSYPTDNIHMCTFQGTDSGRIFLGGKDGAIYEFSYQAQDKWFSRKCRKINHSSSLLSLIVPSFISLAFTEDDAVLQIAVDNTRNILYARLEKGSIQVYDLGKDGKQMSKVHVLHQHAMVQHAFDVARTIDKKNFYPVVHISPVEATESKHVHLVAVTQSGVRLYFTTNGGFGDNRPYTLALLHVRLPPGFTASAVARPLNVHMSYYKKGFLLLTSSQTEENDVVFATSNDSFAFHPQLIETHTTLVLDGHAWCIAEVPTAPALKPITTSKSQEIICDPPALVTQHKDSARQFVFLSTQGSIMLRKPRPVDQLYKLLVDNKGPDSEAVKAFFSIHKPAQACAMCLILACSQNLQEKQIAEWANRAFLMYGGEPHCGIPSVGDTPLSPVTSQLSIGRPSLPPVWASTPQNLQNMSVALPQPQFSNIYSPVKQVLSTSLQQSTSPTDSSFSQPLSNPTLSPPSSEIMYSGKHNGLYLYFSRIVRSVWSTKLVTEFVDVTDVKLMSNISSEEMALHLQQLLALKHFLKNNSQTFMNPTVSSSLAKNGVSRFFVKNDQSTPIDSNSAVYKRKSQNDAELQERVSLANFQRLVNHTYEMLALWKILCDHQFHSIVHYLPQMHQDLLKLLTFKDFIIDGKELSVSLTNALINLYLEDNASTGTISQRLRELCPSIYRVEDATVSRAHEMVLNAKNIANKIDKDHQLLEALKLCKSIAPNVDLGLMCGLFRSVSFYNGILDLCLCCAQRLDPQGLALHFYKNGEPKDDHQGLQSFFNRRNCYKHVIDALNELKSQSLSHPQSPSIPKVPGPPPSRDPNMLAPEEAKANYERIFNMALKTDDELFHVALYDWLIENNDTDNLINTHFLEDYLKRCTAVRPDNLYILNLLWKYYEKNQNFSAAARVLAKLADKHGVELSLSQRIEYLSRAIMCVKGSEMRISTSGEGEFLHELEEKMEVARIQLHIIEALQQKKNSLQKKAPSFQSRNIDDAISALNSNFLHIQQLYEEYAVPFNLPECQLAIIECSGISEVPLIESLWQSIIEKEILATVGTMPDARIKILQQKFVSISQAYVNSEKYFPIEFIIKFMELKTCNFNFKPSWVFETMLNLGITIVDLLKIYHKLYSCKDSCWTACGKPLHLLIVLETLIEFFADSSTIVALNERRSFTTFCLDVMSGYLVDLQAMDPTIQHVTALITEFKKVQRKLERLP